MGTWQISVQDFGAVGDGLTDDTEAIRSAIAALPEKGGVLLFPPGHYLTDTIKPPSFTTLLGYSAWSLTLAGGVVLSPVRDEQPCLIDAEGCLGTRFIGLTLQGLGRGTEMHGLYAKRSDIEQNIVVDDCHIETFSGSGMLLDDCGVWLVRHSVFFRNALDGIDAHRGYDAWITDTQIQGNGRFGLHLLASTTVTGNRIEHNHEAGIRIYSKYADHIQITGNLFCSNWGPAIECFGGDHRCISVTGNTFRYSGAKPKGNELLDCHVHFGGTRGLAMTGNGFNAEGGCPSTGMILQGLKDSVVANNTLHRGATRELIHDEGGHENSVIENNPGSISPPEKKTEA